MFKLGIDKLLNDKNSLELLKRRKVALLAHPASVTSDLTHSLDALMQVGVNVSSAFGPQHGMRGEKQDNMIESEDYEDPIHKIPVFSLYGKVRRPTPQMMSSFDVLLLDLQDVGCRIYTFLTTLFYMMDACQETGKELWILDRPNPAGRGIEGNDLKDGFESFVGAAPLPMRHGLTLGEAGRWYYSLKKMNFRFKVISMDNYDPVKEAWPQLLSWVNPSPNMPRLTCVRQYPGTVLIEGTNVSEGRGTTIPLEIFGMPGMKSESIIKEMSKIAPQWMQACKIRPAFYEPTFHKFKGQLVSALQIHVDGPFYVEEEFKPYRLVALFFKAFHRLHGDVQLWKKPPYEYEEINMPIDILSGDSTLRKWVDDSSGEIGDFEKFLAVDEKEWSRERQDFLLYNS